MEEAVELSLAQLIQPRMRALGITRGDLARRMGYANIAKGCRRIDQICSEQFEMADNLRVALSRGLGVNVEVVNKTIDVTRAERIAAKNRAYRESFKPHAVMLTGETVPSLITGYAMMGGARNRNILFKAQDRIGNPTQHRHGRAFRTVVPFFGSSNRICRKLHARFRSEVQQRRQNW